MSGFRKAYTIRRQSGGTRTNGHWVEGTESNVAITASVQPLTPKEMESLPEGRRTKQAFKLFTDTELKTVETQNPDRITLFGSNFEVLSIAPWRNDVINHYECVVCKYD